MAILCFGIPAPLCYVRRYGIGALTDGIIHFQYFTFCGAGNPTVSLDFEKEGTGIF